MRHVLALFCLLLGNTVIAQGILYDNGVQPKIRISLSKDTFSVNDDVVITIVLTNTSKSNQRFLFDMPRSETFGPAQTSVSLRNSDTELSAIKYSNKRLLESQVYSEDMLKGYYHTLTPGQFLIRQYTLSNLIVIDSPNYKLGRGTYTMEVFYSSSFSNSVIFAVN
jgi:hypothetical protein